MHFHTPAFTRSLCIVAILLTATRLSSQNFVKGSVVDSVHTPVPFCTIALLNAKDSSVVKGNLADDNGAFIFENIRSGEYRIKLINSGFQPLLTAAFKVDSSSKITLDTLSMKGDGINLKEVSVSVFKPAVEFKKGIVVLNVENNLLAGGNTVLELLRRVPGVTIDAQNNIYVNGRTGVRFLIDGRLQQIPLTQLVNMLSGMPADVVSSIELIKNPPAKYDAAGSAGLINIVLKKAKVKGFSGNLSQSISKGEQYRSGTTASINFKSDKLSVFTNASYYDLRFETNNNLIRRIKDTSSVFELYSQSRQLPYRSVLNLSGGIEYEVSKKLILGANVTLNPTQTSNTEVAPAYMITDNPFPYTYYNFNIDTKQKIHNPYFNVNGTYKFDTVGTQLQFSADVTDYREDFSRSMNNRFFNAANVEVLMPNRVNTFMNNRFRIYTQKLDFTKEFKKGLSFEAGAKASFATNNSDALIELTDTLTGDLKRSDMFSNDFHYHERILAAYATLAKSTKKVDVKAGLRTEQTQIDADNAPKDFVLHRNYINLFPSASVDYRVTKKHSVQLNYSYRIDRPRFDQFNPTRVYSDQLDYGTGNPKLKPQYNHYLTAEYDYNHFITLSGGYYLTKDFIYYYAYGNPATKLTIDTVFNYSSRSNLVASVFIQKQVKWLSFQLYGMAAYRQYNGIVNGITANSSTPQYYAYGNIEIMLLKKYKLQITGYYNSKFTDGVQVYYPLKNVDIALQRSFFDKKLDVSLSLYDVFYTNRTPYVNSIGSLYQYYNEFNDTRRVRLYVIWKFGKMKIDRAVKQSNDSEKSRFKSAN